MLSVVILSLALTPTSDPSAEAAVAVALAKHRAEVPPAFPPILAGPNAKVEPRPLVGAYAAIYARVEAGATVYLSVGSDERGFERCDDSPVRPGLYRCWPGPHGPAIEPVTRPEVRVPLPFASVGQPDCPVGQP